MRKYTLAIEIDSVGEGRLYDRMPFHCTLVHWFYTSLAPEEIVTTVTEALRGHAPVTLVSKAAELYGPDHDIPVHSLVPEEALVSLHRRLFEALGHAGVEYTHSEYVGDGYLPHVSTRGGREFSIGSRHEAENIYLVEALDEGIHPKKIVHARIPLK